VRVSVGVTGCTLCLLSEAHVVPQVERPPPAMMYEALESLPHSCHWSVQHAEIADEGRAIAAAIRAGAAVAVSDGSLRYTLGTSAFVIKGMDSAHRIVGYNRVPGPAKDRESHRCDLAGLYAIVTLVNCLCHHHRITQGSILVACDNTGALKPEAVDFLPKCSQKNLDLLQAIWKTLQESPIEWTTQHVYVHQDHKAKDSHRRLAALNCEMDALAKQHWAHIHAKVQLTPAPHISIRNEGWTMWSGTDKVVAPSRNALHSLLADQPTQMWWVRHNRISETAKDLVDWETCSTGMKALKPGRRRWITKHASAHCGVGTTLLTWKYQDDDHCPRYGRSESTTHVLTCTAMGANEVWNENLDKLAQYLTDSDTLPVLQEAILTNLACWR